MSENVALSKKKQKAFNKTVKKTKDKIKKGDIKITGKAPKLPRKKRERGIVYLSNIPHGFYEKELKGYFSQFGHVLKTRVARSKRTGNSKGHAFIMFRQPEVAKIAADTMDNYLMGKRLLKAKLLPFDKKAQGIFKKPNFSKEHYPTMVRRTRFKKSFNAAITEEKQEQKNKSALKHIKNVVDKLKAIGIDYDFQPADPPKKQLIKNEVKKEEKENMDDSSSEDFVFTTPEEMERKAEEAKVELKKNKKQNRENGINTLKKIKKSANSSNINPEKSAKKKNKNKIEVNITEEKQVARKKKNKEKQIETTLNEISSANVREKKQKNRKKKQVSFENIVETISSDGNNEKPKKKEKSKVLALADITENISPNILKKKSKRLEENKKSVNKKTVGVTKKPKKTEKISGKKASLIKELIKDNTQIKTVKKIKNDGITKKNKLKVKN